MEKVTFVLNGKQAEAAPGETILDAARRYGINIPALCYIEGVSPIGACRLCVVEIEGAKTLSASCHTPVRAGMVVNTDSEKVRSARRVIIELLLAAHSGDCLVCENANTCELRRLAAELGAGQSRFRPRRRFYPLEDESPCSPRGARLSARGFATRRAKPREATGIFRDLTRCISCWRCVWACRESAKQGLLSIAYRGSKNKVVSDTDVPLDKKECNSCEECIKICPVGAIKRPPERFRKRREQKLQVIT